MTLVAEERATRWYLPGPGEEQPQAGIDTGVAHIARVYNYWLGGKDNFAADREAAELVITSYPTVLASVRAQREFLGRAVSYIHATQIGTAASRLNQAMAEPVTLRTHAQVGRFFEGLDAVEPGLVQLHRWRAVPADPRVELANYGGVARKR